MAMKKRKLDEGGLKEAAIASDEESASSAAAKKKSSKKKKSKKHKSSASKKNVYDVDSQSVDTTTSTTPAATKEEATASKTDRHAAKKAAKAALNLELQSKIPKLDPDGIPYNKIQTRRMMRRVKHGLDPIPTEQEEHEITKREKRERVEEELLYAEGKDEDNEGEGDGDDGSDIENENNDDDDDGVDEVKDMEDTPAIIPTQEREPKKAKHHNPPSKGTKRSKTVPSDYICQACQNQPSSSDGSNEEFTPHWIYDCPHKKTNRGCNKIAKKLRGLNDPPSRKVFVGGLPFECDEGMVKRFFDEGMMMTSSSSSKEEVELLHVKLLKFEDSKRCKGQAFLTFDCDEGAQLAIRSMNGSVWKDIDEPGMSSKSGKNKKGKTGGGDETKKELRLKVTKVLNRHVTKNSKRG